MMRGLKRSMGCVLALAWCLLAVSPAAAQSARAERDNALNYVPEEAAMFVMVPNLDRFSQNVAAFNETGDIGSPIAADLLSEFKRRVGMTDGIRDDGPLLMVLPEAPAVGQPGGSFLLLMPVRNYGSFIKDMGGKADGVSEVTVENFRGFSRAITGFAVMGQTEAGVKEYLPGRRSGLIRASLGQGGQRVIDQSELAIVINIPQMRNQLMGALQMSNMQASQQLSQAGLDPRQAKMARSMMVLSNTLGRTVINDAQTVVMGFDINQDGLGLSMSVQFDPQSTSGQALASGGDASELIMHLPKRPYIAALSVARGEADFDSMTDAILATLPAVSDGGMVDLAKMRLPMMKQIDRVAAAFYTPSPGMSMLGGGIFNGVVVIDAQDPKAYQMAYQGYLQALNKLSIPVDLPEEAGGGEASVTFNANYQPNALNVDGVQVDQFNMRYNLPPQLMQGMGGQAAPMMMMVAGSGQAGYLATMDDVVVQTTVADPQLIKMAIDAVKKGEGLGTTESIMQVQTNRMTTQSSAQAMLSVSGIMQTVRVLMQMVGAQAPDNDMFNVPADMLPINASMSLSNSNLTGRIDVPMDNVRFITSMLNQFGGSLQQMAPGQQNAPAGPGPAQEDPTGPPFQRR